VKDKIYSIIFIIINIFLLSAMGLGSVDFEGTFSSKLANIGFNIVHSTTLIYAIIFVVFKDSKKVITILMVTSIILYILMIFSWHILNFY